MGKESDRKLVVLSLFDGMSCGQIALHELGIIPYVYYASEIDKHAIGQTQLNFPKTVQLGSVVDVDVSKLEHMPDLLIGGSPCQSFSFAGKRKGMAAKIPTKKQLSDLKELKKAGSNIYEDEFLASEHVEIYTLERYMQVKSEGFEFAGQSYLFWEYMRILNDIRKINPEVKFLLENVEMGKTPTLSSNSWEQNNLLHNDYRIRRLTPTECAALQTVPKWYKWACSDTQIYRMCGNGWTIKVIMHILSFL